jgi:tRNA pseudouridine55 synthase
VKSGLVLINKSEGMTSFDCIRALKRSWKRTDLGHGGTLDKFATGALPVLVGEGLKLVRFFLDEYPTLPTYWKTYAGVFELGSATETGDPEGAVIETLPVPALSVDGVNAAMASFVNTRYEQLPPKYSAKKIGGERSGDLARKGIEAKLEPVLVTIRKFHCTAVRENLVYFEVECSKGTYIRTLAVDLAKKLGTAAHLKALCRLAVGTFRVDQALTLQQIEERGPEAAIQDLTQASSFLPTFPLWGNELEQLRVGKTDGLVTRLANSGQPAGAYRAMTEINGSQQPVALLELTPERRGIFLRAFVTTNS